MSTDGTYVIKVAIDHSVKSIPNYINNIKRERRRKPISVSLMIDIEPKILTEVLKMIENYKNTFHKWTRIEKTYPDYMYDIKGKPIDLTDEIVADLYGLGQEYKNAKQKNRRRRRR